MMPPTSIEAATRSPMMAPAATMMSEPSIPIVKRVSRSRPRAVGRKGISAGKAYGASHFTWAKRSRQSATRPPTIPAVKSARPLATASVPAVCMLRSVSAVAMPVGKGSWSMLMSCRLSGIAMKTPSIDSAPSQSMISHHAMSRPVVR